MKTIKFAGSRFEGGGIVVALFAAFWFCAGAAAGAVVAVATNG